MLRLNKIIILFLIATIPVVVISQTKEELKKQKIAIEKEINYAVELLKRTQANKNKSIDYLNVLQKQIQNKEQLLETLVFEIKFLNKQIKKTENKVLNAEEAILIETQNLNQLREEYAKMIYATFVKKGNRNDLMFCLL